MVGSGQQPAQVQLQQLQWVSQGCMMGMYMLDCVACLTLQRLPLSAMQPPVAEQRCNCAAARARTPLG